MAAGLEKAVQCKKIGITVIGLEVPHTHIHLIPINNIDDMNFNKPKLNPNQEELAETALLIREQLKIVTEE